MSTELIFLVEESEEGGFVASALNDAIFTEADDMTSLKDQVRDAVSCHFDPGQVPKMIRLHYVHEEVIAV
jgi:hypothetical protein